MALVGKRLIVVGADWGDVSIGKLHASLASSTIQPAGTTTVTAWVGSDVTVTTCTCTSSSTATATVGERTGSGTQASPFSWTITGVANGTTTLSVVLNSGLATQETKTFTLTVGSAPVTTYTVGGTVTNGTPATLTTATVSAGGSTTFTITPNTGYALAAEDITVTGTASKSVSGNVVTISNVQSNVTLAIACHQETTSMYYFERITGISASNYTYAYGLGPQYFYIKDFTPYIGKNITKVALRFNATTACSLKLYKVDLSNIGAPNTWTQIGDTISISNPIKYTESAEAGRNEIDIDLSSITSGYSLGFQVTSNGLSVVKSTDTVYQTLPSLAGAYSADASGTTFTDIELKGYLDLYW